MRHQETYIRLQQDPRRQADVLLQHREDRKIIITGHGEALSKLVNHHIRRETAHLIVRSITIGAITQEVRGIVVLAPTRHTLLHREVVVAQPVKASLQVQDQVVDRGAGIN